MAKPYGLSGEGGIALHRDNPRHSVRVRLRHDGAPAIAFFAADGLRRGFGPWEKTALAALYLTPIVARTFTQLTLVPLGVPVMIVTFVLLLRRSTLNFAQPIAFLRHISSEIILK
jgi:hypothetical protein